MTFESLELIRASDQRRPALPILAWDRENDRWLLLEPALPPIYPLRRLRILPSSPPAYA